MNRFNLTPAVILVAAALLTACGDKAAETVTEAPAAEATPQVETSALVVVGETLSAAVVVEQSTDESEAAFIATTQVRTLTAKVVSINPETREVVLVGEDGVELELVASEKAHNLDQVSAGDMVNAKLVERVTIELVKGDNLRASEISTDLQVQAEEGQMPARAEVIQTVNIYTVEAIDIEANTFKLINVEGMVKEFTARNPANLAKAAVGDAVVVTVTEAMAVEVIKATSEEG